MKPEEFISFNDKLPIKNKWVVVTNNISAKDIYGEMSHVWLTCILVRSHADGVITFDAANREIINLTHYKYV